MQNSISNKYATYLFTALYSAGAIFCIFLTSVYIMDIYQYMDTQRIILKILYAVGIAFNIFVFKTYNFKKYIIHFLITILILIAATQSNSYYKISYLWFFLLAIPPISLKQISKAVLTITTVSIISVILITAFGGGENISFIRPGTNFIRYSYGFLNPNLFAAYLFQICITFAYIRWKTWNSKDNILMFSILCLAFFFTNSRTTSILILLLFLAVNISNHIKIKHVIKIPQSLLLICPTFTLITSKLYCMSSPFAYFLDEIFSYRFRNACYSMASYPISFLGNNIKITHDMLLIDNIYANLLIHYGICISLLFFTGYWIMLKKAFKNNNIPLLVILTLTILQGITESIPLIYYLNFSILTFSALLNNTKLFNET